MRKIAFAAMLFVASSGFCQTPVKESDTLQTLLLEVHQLRLDIEAMTGASQRVQIALYGLQMQDAAVTRAAQRLDSARNKCQGEEGNRQHIASEVQRLESSLVSGTAPDAEAKAIRTRAAEMKTALDAQTAVVETCQAAEAEASGQLRNDQGKLAEVQDRIDRLDKALAGLSSGDK